MAFELTGEQRARALQIFTGVLDMAVPAYEIKQFELFSERDEEYIRKEVERMLYEPKLPWAGARERRWVERLMEMARDEDWNEEGRMRARLAAEKFKAVDGWYYTRQPMSAKADKEGYEWLVALRDSAHRSEEWGRKWFAQLLLDGLPRAVADFRMDTLFMLRKSDESTDRLVKLTNVVGESVGPVPLPTAAFHAPVKFREWLLGQGGFSWSAGEKELQLFHQDVNRAVAWKSVREVVSYGWHPLRVKAQPGGARLEGIWFFGNCAFSGGQLLRPDDHGIYWLDGEGFLPSDHGREGAEFHQKLPMLFPDVRCESLTLDISDENRAAVRALSGEPPPAPVDAPPDDALGLSEPASVAMLFREATDRLRRTMGGTEAWCVAGCFAAYAAAPEIFQEYSLFPGLWLHGQAGSGKSTIAEWMMDFWGIHVQRGLNLKSSMVTAVGLMQAADQFSNLPVWADEFRNGEIAPDKMGVIHGAFNRSNAAKFNPNKVQRVIRTAFLVTGESTSSDAALRGRYVHVQVSANRREKDAAGNDVNHAKWFTAHREHFYQFGQFLMRRREEFAELTLRLLKTWRETAQGVSERDKLVYGVPYAAFTAMAHLLQSHSAQELQELKQFTIRHAGEASADVVSELNINVFWTELLNAFKAEAVPLNCFRVERRDLEHAPGRPNQKRWASFKLYIDPDATLSKLSEFLSRQRSSLPLKRKDLRDQLSKNAFWIEGKLRKRFNLGASGAPPLPCWGIKLDEHPQGYQPCTDEEHDRWLMADRDEGDPRLGELYLIVDAVWRKEVGADKEKENTE